MSQETKPLFYTNFFHCKTQPFSSLCELKLLIHCKDRIKSANPPWTQDFLSGHESDMQIRMEKMESKNLTQHIFEHNK